MTNEPTSTIRARRLRERRSRGVVMVALVEIGMGGYEDGMAMPHTLGTSLCRPWFAASMKPEIGRFKPCTSSIIACPRGRRE